MSDFTKLDPFVLRFGLSDDLARSAAVASASETELSDMVKAVKAHDNQLDAYFSTPGIDTMSPHYVALTALRMAADEAEAAKETVSEELRRQRTAEMMAAIFGKKKRGS